MMSHLEFPFYCKPTSFNSLPDLLSLKLGKNKDLTKASSQETGSIADYTIEEVCLVLFLVDEVTF